MSRPSSMSMGWASRIEKLGGGLSGWRQEVGGRRRQNGEVIKMKKQEGAGEEVRSKPAVKRSNLEVKRSNSAMKRSYLEVRYSCSI